MSRKASSRGRLLDMNPYGQERLDGVAVLCASAGFCSCAWPGPGAPAGAHPLTGGLAVFGPWDSSSGLRAPGVVARARPLGVVLATFGEATKESRADAIRSRGGKILRFVKLTEAYRCFTKNGQEPECGPVLNECGSERPLILNQCGFLATFGETARRARYWGSCNSFGICYQIRWACSWLAGSLTRPKR